MPLYPGRSARGPGQWTVPPRAPVPTATVTRDPRPPAEDWKLTPTDDSGRLPFDHVPLGGHGYLPPGAYAPPSVVQNMPIAPHTPITHERALKTALARSGMAPSFYEGAMDRVVRRLADPAYVFTETQVDANGDLLIVFSETAQIEGMMPNGQTTNAYAQARGALRADRAGRAAMQVSRAAAGRAADHVDLLGVAGGSHMPQVEAPHSVARHAVRDGTHTHSMVDAAWDQRGYQAAAPEAMDLEMTHPLRVRPEAGPMVALPEAMHARQSGPIIYDPKLTGQLNRDAAHAPSGVEGRHNGKAGEAAGRATYHAQEQRAPVHGGMHGTAAYEGFVQEGTATQQGHARMTTPHAAATGWGVGDLPAADMHLNPGDDEEAHTRFQVPNGGRAHDAHAGAGAAADGLYLAPGRDTAGRTSVYGAGTLGIPRTGEARSGTIPAMHIAPVHERARATFHATEGADPTNFRQAGHGEMYLAPGTQTAGKTTVRAASAGPRVVAGNDRPLSHDEMFINEGTVHAQKAVSYLAGPTTQNSARPVRNSNDAEVRAEHEYGGGRQNVVGARDAVFQLGNTRDVREVYGYADIRGARHNVHAREGVQAAEAGRIETDTVQAARVGVAGSTAARHAMHAAGATTRLPHALHSVAAGHAPVPNFMDSRQRYLARMGGAGGLMDRMRAYSSSSLSSLDMAH